MYTENFNPRTPIRGATVDFNDVVWVKTDFNPRTPIRGATAKRVKF